MHRALIVICLLTGWVTAQELGTRASFDGGQAFVLQKTAAPVPCAYPELYGWVMWWSANREEFLESSAAGPESRSGATSGGLTAETVRRRVRGRVTPVLVAALKDPERDVRRSAAMALGLCGGADEAAALMAALADGDRAVREAAIVGLGLLEQQRADLALAGILANEELNARDRGFAALAMGLSGGAENRRLLSDGLGGGRFPSSVETCRVLGLALWAGADKGRALDRATEAAGAIRKAIGSSDIKDRAFLGVGAAALAKTRDSGSADCIVHALEDPRRELRLGTAIAAGRVIHATEVARVQALIEAARGEGHPLTRRLMLISLGRIGGAEAKKFLLEELAAKERHRRSFAALGLGLANATECAPRLREELRAVRDERVQGACMIALGLMKDPATIDLVVEMTKTLWTDELRSHYAWFFALTRDPRGLLTAKRLMETQDSEYQQLGALVLAVIGSKGALEVLIESFEKTQPATRRAAAAEGLGRLGDSRALDPLLSTASSKEETPLIRAAAIAALGVLARRAPALPFPRIAIDSYYDGILSEPIDDLSRLAGTGRLNAEERGNRGH